jgi:hypothetical protein
VHGTCVDGCSMWFMALLLCMRCVIGSLRTSQQRVTDLLLRVAAPGGSTCVWAEQVPHCMFAWDVAPAQWNSQHCCTRTPELCCCRMLDTATGLGAGPTQCNPHGAPTVLYLCGGIGAGLLRNEQRGGRAVQEGICLRGCFCFWDNIRQLFQVRVCLDVGVPAPFHGLRRAWRYTPRRARLLPGSCQRCMSTMQCHY